MLVSGDDGRLKAVVGILEPQARNIEIGQPASIEAAETRIPGKVVRITAPRIENSLVNIEVSLEANLPANIRAGLTVDGMVEVERFEDILYVGRPSHGQADSTSTLFKLEDDGLTAVRVRVRFGRSSVTTIEILDGLKVGDNVILSDMSAYDGVETIKLK